MNISYAETDSPIPSIEWFNLTDLQRLEKINQIINHDELAFKKQLFIVLAKKDGQVIVRMLSSLKASERGPLLLDFEEYIKKQVDQGLSVWCEPLGDKNSLRNLRGIEVKVS